MAKSPALIAIYVALLAVPLGYLYNTYYPVVQRTITVFGIYRSPSAVSVASAEDLVLIDGTIHCEDIHYYAPSHELYMACEDSPVTRFSWFPPLAEFNASVLSQSQGTLVVIDPDTKKARKLKLDNFYGPFVTHGIDVIADPKAGAKKAVYIFAVNHLPNPDFWDESFVPRTTTTASSSSQPAKTRSQIEIFRHEIGSATARHIRSVRDPLIRTPNDILALSPQRFLVTNDHHYREGFMREVEDINPFAAWTETVQVDLSDLLAASADQGIKTSVVVEGIHNNNGLGRGRTDTELLIASAAGGSLHFVEPSPAQADHSFQIVDKLLLDSTIDNPSYFKDPYASATFDGSGYVLAGLSRAIDLAKTHADPQAKEPVIVWYVKKVDDAWEKRIIFEDDGSTLRSASAAVLIAIDPAKEGGKRRAWLYVTGFISSNVVAVKIDL
ncbi:hypothetical protein PFICI_00646 [Pestalotiopsis fici W106-1]|uniref:Serum paraoxonase/arylesterase 2 n=1 Tax=Pestalotiopsis fici (strain W106-1 / CGMCC3.15140) TaxID=1229662 RepID=W3XL77_PESFW|nr:uncharacterized protein PFICI_00646 [Pestalotiopsis fici W106-1]ETS86818.1 hypothetical protein PFICI_00646 [Pestalotiopsis fici W106-1]